MTIPSLRNLAFLANPDVAPLDFSTLGPQIFDFNADIGVQHTALQVDQWDDQSAEGNDAVQATAALQPTLIENDVDFNGHNSVDFDGTEYLQNATFSGGAESQPNTVFYVGILRELVNIVYMFDGAQARQAFNTFPSGRPWNLHAGSGVDPGPTSDSSLHVFGLLFNSINSAGYLDGVEWSSGAQIGTATFNGINLGSRTNIGAQELDGKMARAIGYSDSLSVANMNLAGNELARLYGTVWTDIP